MAEKSDGKSRSGLTFKLVLIVLILLLIPTTMEQMSAHEDTVRNVGRVCVGIALLFFFYGLLSKALRFSGMVLLVLIIGRVLANEGVVEVPKLRAKIEERQESRPR